MNNRIQERFGWIDNNWGSINQLKISINDRGLNFGDGIFETILLCNGKAKLLTAHLNRWHASASYLGMAKPPNENKINTLITEVIEKYSLMKGYASLRLNWSRGNNINRGINIENDYIYNKNHSFWMELSHINPCFNPISVMISNNEKRNANSKINLHKTFGYGQSIQAKKEAKDSGYDDAILESTNGYICCGTTSNLIVKRNNKYLTPYGSSGCLPGIMRQQGLNSGSIKESNLYSYPEENDEWLIINSLCCQPIYKINNTFLNIFSNPKEFWISLYNC
tara:strand:- start:187 stop:1026 length:840 start_codon:yes stop_codon:yes gene_type:complete